MKHFLVLSRPELREFVDRFEYFEVTKEELPTDRILLFPGLESGISFLTHPGKPLKLESDTLAKKEIELPEVSLVPYQNKPFYNQFPGRHLIFRVVLRPYVLAQLFDVSLKDYQNDVPDASYAVDKELKYLHERIASMESFAMKVQTFEEYLIKRLVKTPIEFKTFRGLDLLFRDKGYGLSTEAIAKYIGLSSRQINRHLNENVGFPLSHFRRLHRFVRLVETLENRPSKPLTEIAYDFDYCDQAHFSNEFREMSTMSPGQYMQMRRFIETHAYESKRREG